MCFRVTEKVSVKKEVLNEHEMDYTVELLIQQVGGSHSDLVLGW